MQSFVVLCAKSHTKKYRFGFASSYNISEHREIESIATRGMNRRDIRVSVDQRFGSYFQNISQQQIFCASSRMWEKIAVTFI